MRRTILTISAALLVASSAAAMAPAAGTPVKTPASKAHVAKDACSTAKSKFARAQCENYHHSAPGDAYFGRMKLSYLGINNTFHDAAISAGGYTTDPGIIGKVGFADEALNQWASRYPGDPDLARSYFLAIQIYKKIYTETAQRKAYQYMQTLVVHFPASYFGKLERADLARGFTEHWFALPELCPTPLPSGAPLPEETPVATATPSSAPGQPHVDLITPPCVAPTPLPTESPMEEATQAPSGAPIEEPTPVPSEPPAPTPSP